MIIPETEMDSQGFPGSLAKNSLSAWSSHSGAHPSRDRNFIQELAKNLIFFHEQNVEKWRIYFQAVEVVSGWTLCEKGGQAKPRSTCFFCSTMDIFHNGRGQPKLTYVYMFLIAKRSQ